MSTRPRVVVIPSSYFAGERTVGGGERYALEYARALSTMTPTTLALFGTTPAVERDGALEVRTVQARHTDVNRYFPLGRVGSAELAGFDVVHLMIFPTPLTDQIILKSRLRRQTVVLTDVGGGVPTWSTYLQKLNPRWSLSRLAHGLAHLSRYSADQFSDWRQPATVLHGGAPLPDLPSGDVNPGEYALYVGRLLPHKGVLQLIEAISPDTPLRVVGRPYSRDYFRRLEAAAGGKRVTFILDADDAELQRQYRGASVVLQPSIPVMDGARDNSELLGLVTLEGMAHGKPVIVTRAGSLPELVNDGVTGFVVPPNDLGALRDSVQRLVSDAELSRRMGAAARSHVEANFNWRSTAARGLELYRQLRSGR